MHCVWQMWTIPVFNKAEVFLFICLSLWKTISFALLIPFVVQIVFFSYFFVYRISLKVIWYIFQFAMTGNIYQTKHVFHVKIVVRTLHRAIKWQGDVMLDAVITGLENIVKVGMDYFNHILDFFIPFSWFRFDCFLQTKNNLTIKLIYNAYNHVKYNFPQKLYNSWVKTFKK